MYQAVLYLPNLICNSLMGSTVFLIVHEAEARKAKSFASSDALSDSQHCAKDKKYVLLISIGLPWWLRSAYNVEDLGSVPGLGRLPGGGHDNPLQYSCQENPQGQRSLVGCSPWGCKESDTTEQLSTHLDDLPDPGIGPGSPALQAGTLLSEPPGKSRSQSPGLKEEHEK